MGIVRKVVLVVGLLVLLLFGAVFAVNNPSSISVDIGVTRFESVSMPLAFAAAVAVGWVLGVACALPSMLRLGAERRRLRRRLERAQAQLHDSGRAASDAD